MEREHSVYISNEKMGPYLTKRADGLYCNGVLRLTKEQYLRMMSQKNSVSSDPLRPKNLDEDVEEFVMKAKEASMLALDIYNRPGTVFRTQGFTVMMIIAWTSLFHSFHRRGTEVLTETQMAALCLLMVMRRHGN